MNTSAYRAANTIWVDHILDRNSRSKSIICLLSVSLMPWLLGFLISLWIGKMQQYLHTPIFYVASFGIFLTIGSLGFGSFSQYKMYDRILACFVVSESERRGSIISALERHSNFYNHIRASVIIFIFSVTVAALGCFFWNEINFISAEFGTILPRFQAFEKYDWYDETISAEFFAIQVIFLLFISPPLGTAASIMLRFPTFLWEISKKTPRYPPNLIKAYFAPAATFYAYVSVLWLLGVFLIYYFLGQNMDLFSDIGVAFAFLIGVINFYLPQVAYVRVVSASEQQLLDIISNFFNAESSDNRGNNNVMIQANSEESQRILALVNLMTHNEWVYPMHQTYAVVGIYLISLITSIIGWDQIRNYIETSL